MLPSWQDGGPSQLIVGVGQPSLRASAMDLHRAPRALHHTIATASQPRPMPRGLGATHLDQLTLEVALALDLLLIVVLLVHLPIVESPINLQQG